jgi:hypothetical protein
MTEQLLKERLITRGYEELALESLKDYPDLTECYRAWLQAKRGDFAPTGIDLDMIPRSVWPYVMLLDYLPEERDVSVRIAGNYVGERTSSNGDGRRLRNYFSEADARTVFDSLRAVADSCEPSLARRSYVSIEGREYHYVRIILPLSVDGRRVTGFFKTIEPDTLRVV